MNLNLSEVIELTKNSSPEVQEQFAEEFELVLESLPDADQIKALSGAPKDLIDRVFRALKPLVRKEILRRQWEDFVNRCPSCDGGIVYDAEFDKWFSCSICRGTGKQWI